MHILHAAAALAVCRQEYLFWRSLVLGRPDPWPDFVASYQAARKRYAVARCAYKALWNAETAHLRYPQA